MYLCVTHISTQSAQKSAEYYYYEHSTNINKYIKLHNKSLPFHQSFCSVSG